MLILFKTSSAKFSFSIVIIVLITGWMSCSKSDVAPKPAPPLIGVTSFALLRDSIIVHATSVTKGDSVLITVPGTTNPNGLTTKIILGNGTSVSPASGVSQDFTNPVTYTATFSDGTTKNTSLKLF